MTQYHELAEKELFKSQHGYMLRLGVKDDVVIFDIGANIGQSIEEYRRLFPGSVITSFEPLPRCFDELIEKYQGKPGITLRNIAFSEKPGRGTFHATRCSTVSSLLRPDRRIQELSPKRNYDFDIIQVNIDTIDQYCLSNDIETMDILKIDVQGAELAVLKGAERLLSGDRIRLIYLEVICADNYEGQSDLQSLIQYLAQWRYALWDFRPFLYTKSGRLWAANAIFMSRPSVDFLEQQ